MDERERQELLERLRTSRDVVLNVTSGLTPEQWAFQPHPDRWSIHQVLEHVVKVENRMMGIIEQKILSAPEPQRKSDAEDRLVIETLPNRQLRRSAPETAQPVGQWPAGAPITAEFEKARRHSEEFALTTTVNLRHYFHPHGFFGELDCYQWLLLLALHSGRHAAQMEEVKQSPGFPAAAAASA